MKNSTKEIKNELLRKGSRVNKMEKRISNTDNRTLEMMQREEEGLQHKK